jgi:N-methylhydantoinase A/oxoprolinase/acetone carboxylase beta subunit
MKNVTARLRWIGGASLLALAVGCATTMRTEDLLSAAGFKIVPATTPELQARLKTIPAHKVTMVQRDGKEYFVYPDVTQNVLYVGQNAQYQRYQQLREQNQLAQEQLHAAELNADWGAWGSWGGEGWWSPLSP